jgi:HSP20 family molecular chaperone IbpA
MTHRSRTSIAPHQTRESAHLGRPLIAVKSVQRWLDAIEQWFPEVFRRLARASLFRDSPDVDVRVDVIEHGKTHDVRAEIPRAKKEYSRVLSAAPTCTLHWVLV